MDRGRSTAIGQGLVEYGLILAGTALVAVVTLVVLGPVLSEILRLIGQAIDAATGASAVLH